LILLVEGGHDGKTDTSEYTNVSFRRLIEGGYIYVDKTPYIYELIKELGGVYFLSRPRRFGKSLLISTLDEIFQGNKETKSYLMSYGWRRVTIRGESIL